MLLPSVAEPKHVEVYMKLSDAIIHEISPETIRDYLDPDFPIEKLDEYLKTYTKPSDIPQYAQLLLDTVNEAPVSSTRLFIVLMTVLDSRILAPSLTGSLTLVRDMTLEEREALLRSWRDSYLESKRRIFKLIYTLTINIFLSFGTDLHYKAIGHPGRELRSKAYDTHEVDDFKYALVEPPKHEGHELYIPDIDVLIIGSGSGAGVVANNLAEAGFKSLVLEKGKYFSNSEYTFNDKEGFTALYEGGGKVTTTNQELFLLAGATFGGGSTVNWSACVKTPFKVRKEWYDDYGIDWAAQEVYDDSMNYVMEQMGASNENIDHSFSNRVILDGGKKLGYKVKAIPQNNGAHESHNCGLCYLGCRFGIKQGSLAFWFKHAAAHGSRFMDQVRVKSVLHKDGKADGVLCEDIKTGITFTIKGPKKIVVSGGSLNTPVVLQNSGFKNKHIGANLKLHPVTCVLGRFDKSIRTRPYEKPIMTSLCDEVSDLDGKLHGPKIETMLHAPQIEAAFLPWISSDESRKDHLQYNNTSCLLVLHRDSSSGKVSADPARPESLVIDYSINKFDRKALNVGVVCGADMLYIQGAEEIIHPQNGFPRFRSKKPASERSINDADYQKWRKEALKIVPDSQGCPYGTAHQMSSCRMSGKGPSKGALDTKGRLFECKNVWVADSSAMPTASGANPMVSTMAIAKIVSDNLIKELQPTVKL